MYAIIKLQNLNFKSNKLQCNDFTDAVVVQPHLALHASRELNTKILLQNSTWYA